MIGLLILAVLLLSFAATLFFGSRQIDINQAVRARFRGLTMDTTVTARRQGRHYVLVDWWSRKLQRAGLEVSRKTTLPIFGGSAAAFVAGVSLWG
ncbi:MAG TPA: hypothetical protein VIR60_02060, partial [Gammaproteobacteria bacterium]